MIHADYCRRKTAGKSNVCLGVGHIAGRRNAANMLRGVKTLDPRFRKWTDDEIKDLWENYPTGDISEIAKRLGRSENAIIQKAQLFGIVKKVRKKPVITKKRISVASEDAFLPKVNHIQALQNLDDKVSVFLQALKRYKLPDNIKTFVSEIEFLQRVVVVRRQVECGFRKVN